MTTTPNDDTTMEGGRRDDDDDDDGEVRKSREVRTVRGTMLLPPGTALPLVMAPS
jgi:hypothetical protein